MKIIDNNIHTPEFIKKCVENRLEAEISKIKRLEDAFMRCYAIGADCEICPYKELGKDKCQGILTDGIQEIIENQIKEYRQYLIHIQTL